MITFSYELTSHKVTIRYSGETSIMLPNLVDMLKSDFEGTCKFVYNNISKDTLTFQEFHSQMRAELFKHEVIKVSGGK